MSIYGGIEPDKEKYFLSNVATSIEALVNTQVILQLLVKKGIFTREEVEARRMLIMAQPKYAQMISVLQNRLEIIEYGDKFEEIFKKKLNGTATDEEEKWLREQVDQM